MNSNRSAKKKEMTQKQNYVFFAEYSRNTFDHHRYSSKASMKDGMLLFILIYESCEEKQSSLFAVYALFLRTQSWTFFLFYERLCIC